MPSEKEHNSPEIKEALKTEKEKAADVAYTLNHTIICTATDFIDPFVGNFVQKHLGNASQLENCWKAEVIGDFGAIPLTVGMQRLFPSVMEGAKKILEPVFSETFRKSAEKEGKIWAVRHGYSIDSQKYKDRVDRIYNYELNHLPQALMWTVSSIALNISSQKWLGNIAPISHIFAGKIGGAALTSAIAIGGRSLFPYKAEKWDKFVSEKLLLPVEEKTEEILGLEEKHKKGWKNRMKNNDDNEKSRSL